MLIVSLPVSALKVAGPSLSCASASRIYHEYKVSYDYLIRDIHVWKPYITGWVLGGLGGVFGFVGGSVQSKEFINIGMGLSIGRDIAWGVATIWSVVYAIRKRSNVKERTSKVSLIPLSGTNSEGVAIIIRF